MSIFYFMFYSIFFRNSANQRKRSKKNNILLLLLSQTTFIGLRERGSEGIACLFAIFVGQGLSVSSCEDTLWSSVCIPLCYIQICADYVCLYHKQQNRGWIDISAPIH